MKGPQITARTDRAHVGATMTEEGVTLYRETIRNGKLAWSKIGSAKWDAHHGLYSISALMPSGEVEALERAIRSS